MECPISRDVITTVCELTTCGHVFDLLSIFQYMVSRTLPFACPICRSVFTQNDVYHSRELQKRITVSLRSISTQTENVDHPGDYFRIIDADVDHFNPQSSTILSTDKMDELMAYNSRFSGRLRLWKFIYQSSEDVVTTAINLARTGYFIYDIFGVSTAGSLTKYVIYSTDARLDGSVNKLSVFKK